MGPSCNIVGRDVVEGSVAILRRCWLRISGWILTRWNSFTTCAHRHCIESNDVEHVVKRLESFVRSHNRCGDLILLSISEEVVKIKSIFSRLSSKTAFKAEVDDNPLAEASAEVWCSGMASSVREPCRQHWPIRCRASRQICLGDPFVELCEGHGEHARKLGPAGDL